MLNASQTCTFNICFLSSEFLNLSFDSFFNFWNNLVFIPAHHGPKLYLTWRHLSLLVLQPLCLDLPPYLDEKPSHSLCFLSPVCCILWACSILFILVLRWKVLRKQVKNKLAAVSDLVSLLYNTDISKPWQFFLHKIPSKKNMAFWVFSIYKLLQIKFLISIFLKLNNYF